MRANDRQLAKLAAPEWQLPGVKGSRIYARIYILHNPTKKLTGEARDIRDVLRGSLVCSHMMRAVCLRYEAHLTGPMRGRGHDL